MRLSCGLLAGAALAFAGPAFGQALPAAPLAGPGVIVYDPTNSRNFFTELLQWAKQLAYAEQTVQHTLATFQSLSGHFDINNLGAALNQAFQNPMAFQSNVAPGYIGGKTSPSGLPFGQQYLSQNTIGQLPNPGTPRTDLIIQAVNTLSGIQAASTRYFQVWEQRLPTLQDVRSQIPGADTAQKLAAVNANINYQKALTDGWNAASINLNTAASTQHRVLEQQVEQVNYQQEGAGLKAACTAAAASGIGSPVAACTTQPGGGGTTLASAPATSTSTPTVSFVSAPASFAPASAGPNS